VRYTGKRPGEHLAAEYRLIRRLRPRLNRAHNVRTAENDVYAAAT
jgi:hypothetical protein